MSTLDLLKMRRLNAGERVCRLDNVARLGTYRATSSDGRWCDVTWDDGRVGSVASSFADRRVMLRSVAECNPLLIEQAGRSLELFDQFELRGVLSDLGCETETIDTAIRVIETSLAIDGTAWSFYRIWCAGRRMHSRFATEVQS